MKAFDCKMCGACCYGEGGIIVRQEELKKIARFLGIGVDTMVREYCETRHGRLYIRCGPDRYCIFFDREKQCLIHPVKPAPCTSWPFYTALLNDRENWEMAKTACPGINPDCSHEEFVAQAEKGAE